MTLVLLVLAMLLAVVTLLPLSTHTAWWVRVWDFPRAQIATLCAAWLAAMATVGDASGLAFWLPLAVVSACLVYQLWWIVPYTPLFPREVRPASADAAARLRLLVANVLTPNRQADALIGLIRAHDPDLFVTVETDGWWESRLDVLAADYPHAMRCPLDNLYGMHVYSRLPLRDAEIRYLVEEGVPSMHAEAVLDNGVGVRMHFLHPAPPSPTENEESVERDVELVMVAKSLSEHEGPAIVTGDLNDVAWSRTTRLFRRLSGLLDPRVGRGMFNTYHARVPLMRWPLDHIFHSDHFTLAAIRRLPAFGSDHFAVLVELAFEPAVPQEGLAETAEAHEEAEETLEEMDADSADVPEPGADGAR